MSKERLYPRVGKKGLKESATDVPAANLSEAQKESIREMRRNFKAQAADLPQEERKQAKQQMRADILNNVLESDEQREALSACWEKRAGKKAPKATKNRLNLFS